MAASTGEKISWPMTSAPRKIIIIKCNVYVNVWFGSLIDQYEEFDDGKKEQVGANMRMRSMMNGTTKNKKKIS